LFYYIGLEMDLKAFAKNIKRSALVSALNTSLPLVAGFCIMYFLFKLDVLASSIIGVCLAVSAQSVTADLLEELKLLRSRIGSMLMAAGAVDDTIELVLVSILLSVFHFATSAVTLSVLAVDTIIFLLVIISARVWFIPYTLKFFDKEHSSTARFMASMIIVLLIASFAEMLSVGLLIGAMVAGMIVRQTIFKDVTIPNWEEHDIARSTHIIAFGFLIPLFFVWVGINTDMALVYHNVWLIALFLLIAVFCTVIGTTIAVVMTKGTFKEGFIMGWGLTPKGDVELVIAALALNSAIISRDIFTSLVMTSLLTMVISPLVFKRLIVRHISTR